MVSLCFYASLISTLISATIGVTSLWLTGIISDSAYMNTWRAWWIGDALGILTMTPLLLTWPQARRTLTRFMNGLARSPETEQRFAGHAMPRLFEAAMLLLGAIVMNTLIFRGDAFTKILHLPPMTFMLYCIFPIAIWAALRFGTHVGSLSTLLTSVFAITATTQGIGRECKKFCVTGDYYDRASSGMRSPNTILS